MFFKGHLEIFGARGQNRLQAHHTGEAVAAVPSVAQSWVLLPATAAVWSSTPSVPPPPPPPPPPTRTCLAQRCRNRAPLIARHLLSSAALVIRSLPNVISKSTTIYKQNFTFCLYVQLYIEK